MTAEEIAFACVTSLRAAEVRMIGDKKAHGIVNAAVSGREFEIDRTPGFGRENEIVEAVKLIFEFAAFVKTLVELYGIIQDRTGRKPTKAQLVTEATTVSDRVPAQAEDAAEIVILRLSASDGAREHGHESE